MQYLTLYNLIKKKEITFSCKKNQTLTNPQDIYQDIPNNCYDWFNILVKKNEFLCLDYNFKLNNDSI